MDPRLKRSLRVIAVDRGCSLSPPRHPPPLPLTGQSSWRDRINENKKHLFSLILDRRKAVREPSATTTSVHPWTELCTFWVDFLGDWVGNTKVTGVCFLNAGSLGTWNMPPFSMSFHQVSYAYSMWGTYSVKFVLRVVCVLTALVRHHPKHKSYQ